MIKEAWLNIPIKDLNKTKSFFESLGFELVREADDMVGFEVGAKKTPIMMVEESFFQKYAGASASDTTKGSELLISIDVETIEDVDETAEKVRAAGGTIFSEPSEIDGWMYGFGFSDPDGHRWNMVHFQ